MDENYKLLPKLQYLVGDRVSLIKAKINSLLQEGSSPFQGLKSGMGKGFESLRLIAIQDAISLT